MLGEHGKIWQSWVVRDVEDAAERQLIYAFFYFYLLLAVFSYFWYLIASLEKRMDGS